VHTVLIVAGILAITAGMLLLAPLGIRALATLAGRAPVAVRLALRDLARYQAPSAAATPYKPSRRWTSDKELL